MGIELVEGQDLFVRDDILYMRTTRGPSASTWFIDGSMTTFSIRRPSGRIRHLACRAFAAYRAGHVTIANAIGTGVADDKSIYPYVPEMVRFYLSEEPMVANVPTWVLRRPEDRAYALANLADLVVKEVHGAGGYGMLIGPASTRGPDRGFPGPHRSASRALHRAADAGSVDLADLRGVGTRASPHRPAAVRTLRPGDHGGAGRPTRVALREGSLVVNSSQGGGTKDTWVLGA